LAVGDPDSVPAGIYAKAALVKLGIWPKLSDRLARAENVRSALLYVARGECRLGIVYATDAQIEPKVRVAAEFSPEDYPPIIYPAALLGSAPDAVDVFTFLKGETAARIFARYGFQVLSTAGNSH
jgi:molybdate transport system substrate-binding protein